MLKTAEEAPASPERFWDYTGKQSVGAGQQCIISGSLWLTGIATQWVLALDAQRQGGVAMTLIFDSYEEE